MAPSPLLFPSPFQRRAEGAVEGLVPVIVALDHRQLRQNAGRKIRRSIGRVRSEILAAPDGGTADAVGGAAKS